MAENYEQFVTSMAEARFLGNALIAIPQEDIEKLQTWTAEHPNIWTEIKEKADSFETRATLLRETQAPEYLEGMAAYENILESIRETVKPTDIPEYGRTTSYQITDAQQQLLNKLVFVGVPARNEDVRERIGGIQEVFMSENKQEIEAPRAK